jgi:hypothetical protein
MISVNVTTYYNKGDCVHNNPNGIKHIFEYTDLNACLDHEVSEHITFNSSNVVRKSDNSVQMQFFKDSECKDLIEMVTDGEHEQKTEILLEHDSCVKWQMQPKISDYRNFWGLFKHNNFIKATWDGGENALTTPTVVPTVVPTATVAPKPTTVAPKPTTVAPKTAAAKTTTAAAKTTTAAAKPTTATASVSETNTSTATDVPEETNKPGTAAFIASNVAFSVLAIASSTLF